MTNNNSNEEDVVGSWDATQLIVDERAAAKEQRRLLTKWAYSSSSEPLDQLIEHLCNGSLQFTSRFGAGEVTLTRERLRHVLMRHVVPRIDATTFNVRYSTLLRLIILCLQCWFNNCCF